MAVETYDLYIGGKKHTAIEKKQVFSYVIGLCMPHLQYMSKEAILDWIKETCSLMEETLTWGKNPTLKRRIGYTREYLAKREDELSREILMSIVINIILAGNGMSTLSGFGYGVEGSKFQINPELTSIRNI